MTAHPPSDPAAEAVSALREALTKINAIRNSIIGFQTVNWSEHVYPLVAALNAAGFKGVEYEEARYNAGTLLEQIKAAEADNAALRTRAEEAERERDEAIAACIAVRKSIMRFPGSVHDRAMAKIDKVLNRAPVGFIDPDEARADRLATELAEARAEVARQSARVEAALTEACRMPAILLMAGEMTAQERRTARAVAVGITSKIRCALTTAKGDDDVDA